MNAAVLLRAVGRRRAPWVGTAVLTLVTVLVTAYAVVSMRLILSDSLTAPPAKIFNYWDPPSCISGSFGTAMLNSTIVAVATVDIGIVMAIFTAFALSWLHFRFRELIFGLVVISFLIPFDAVSIPLSGTFRDWGLSNSLIGLILPGPANGHAVFLVRQFCFGIPRELIGASRIDGMTNRQMLIYVFVPLAPARDYRGRALVVLDAVAGVPMAVAHHHRPEQRGRSRRAGCFRHAILDGLPRHVRRRGAHHRAADGAHALAAALFHPDRCRR